MFLLAISLYTHHLLIHLPVCHPLSLHHCTHEEHFGLRQVAQYNLDNSLHEAAAVAVAAAAAVAAVAATAAAAAHVAYRPWNASSCDDSTGARKSNK